MCYNDSMLLVLPGTPLTQIGVKYVPENLTSLLSNYRISSCATSPKAWSSYFLVKAVANLSRRESHDPIDLGA
jgi:hypothetical protein